MHWLLLAFISVITLSVANIFQKIAMQKQDSDPIASAIVFQFLLGICGSVFALIKGFSLPSSNLIIFFVGSALLYTYGSVCFFRAIKLIEASEMTIIGGLGTIMTIIASVIFLKDSITSIQILGAFCILFAIILINYQKQKITIGPGTWLAVAGATSYGLAIIFDSFIIKRYNAVSFLPIASFGPGIILALWFHNKTKKIVQAIFSINKNLIIYGILYSISAISFYIALENGALVGALSTVTKSSIIMTVLLSSIFLNERKNINKKIIGAILTTIGVILVVQ